METFFADDISRWIFINVRFRILIRVSMKLVSSDVRTDNKSALVQGMDWHRTGDKLRHPWPSLMTHYDDVIMSEIASQITSLTIVYSTVHSGADQSKHQSSASLAFVWEIHRWPVNFPHKWPVTRKIFPFDDVIMTYICVTGGQWV